MTRERTDATNAFYQTWVPIMTHIITFGCQLNKQQKKCKAINVIISDKAKMLHFIGQMYKSNYFTEEQMTKYEILADSDKVWEKTHPLHGSLRTAQGLWQQQGGQQRFQECCPCPRKFFGPQCHHH